MIFVDIVDFVGLPAIEQDVAAGDFGKVISQRGSPGAGTEKRDLHTYKDKTCTPALQQVSREEGEGVSFGLPSFPCVFARSVYSYASV